MATQASVDTGWCTSYGGGPILFSAGRSNVHATARPLAGPRSALGAARTDPNEGVGPAPNAETLHPCKARSAARATSETNDRRALQRSSISRGRRAWRGRADLHDRAHGVSRADGRGWPSGTAVRSSPSSTSSWGVLSGRTSMPAFGTSFSIEELHSSMSSQWTLRNRTKKSNGRDQLNFCNRSGHVSGAIPRPVGPARHVAPSRDPWHGTCCSALRSLFPAACRRLQVVRLSQSKGAA
jgi:hypothetical protein